MVPLETDLSKISYWAQKREDQNYRFRTFLKGQSESKTDRLVHAINNEVKNQIDCTQCGNCCKVLRPSVKGKRLIHFQRLIRYHGKNLSKNIPQKKILKLHFI